MSERCKETVSRGRMNTGQCVRKSVRDGYCKQHHPDTEKAKREAWEAQWATNRAKRELAAGIEKAERAIVDAADKWRGPLLIEQDEIAAHMLVDAVDAWRKLKGGA